MDTSPAPNPAKGGGYGAPTPFRPAEIDHLSPTVPCVAPPRPLTVRHGRTLAFRGHPPASPEFWQDAASMALIEGEIVNCVISPQRGKGLYAKFFVRRWKEDVLGRLAQ